MEEIREVAIKRNGIGYLLQTGAEIERVTPCEVERLMESILRNHPGVPDGVVAAWNNRYAPVIEVSEHYGVKDLEVEVTGYTATVLIVGAELSHTKTAIHDKPEGAIAEAENHWGDILHTLPEFRQLNSSKLKAEDDLVTAKAEAFCKEQGITMDELWAMVNEVNQESEDEEVSES